MSRNGKMIARLALAVWMLAVMALYAVLYILPKIKDLF